MHRQWWQHLGRIRLRRARRLMGSSDDTKRTNLKARILAADFQRVTTQLTDLIRRQFHKRDPAADIHCLPEAGGMLDVLLETPTYG